MSGESIGARFLPYQRWKKLFVLLFTMEVSSRTSNVSRSTRKKFILIGKVSGAYLVAKAESSVHR